MLKEKVVLHIFGLPATGFLDEHTVLVEKQHRCLAPYCQQTEETRKGGSQPSHHSGAAHSSLLMLSSQMAWCTNTASRVFVLEPKTDTVLFSISEYPELCTCSFLRGRCCLCSAWHYLAILQNTAWLEKRCLPVSIKIPLRCSDCHITNLKLNLSSAVLAMCFLPSCHG